MLLCGGQLVGADEIIARCKAGTFLELLVEWTSHHHDENIDKKFQTVLVDLHNERRIDVLAPAHTIETSSIDQHQFFAIMHLYHGLIPGLEAETHNMLAAVKALVARAGNDLAGSLPINAFRTWAERSGRALSILAAIDAFDPKDASYVFTSIQALAKNQPHEAFDIAIKYLEGAATPARSAAAKAIGTIELPTLDIRLRAVAMLTAAHSSADDNTLGHILTAICEIARVSSDMEAAAVTLLDKSLPIVEEQAIHQLSFELMLHGDELAPAIVACLTAIMHKVEISNRGTLNNIDAAAHALLAKNHLDQALALVTPLLLKHDALVSLEMFDGFAYALLQLAPSQIAKVVTKWLLSLNTNLGIATMSLVKSYRSKTPLLLRVESEALGLSDSDAVLLVYRAIGYLFVHPITATSLALGVVRSKSNIPCKAIAELIFDPLLINYSGELADWLRKQAEDTSDSAHSLIIDLLNRLETYVDQLRKIGHIKELNPSERERLIEKRRHYESMRRARKQADDNSLLKLIASRSVILYGNRSISYIKGPDGKMHRNEIKMHSFTHSVEIPRINVLEPFDLDYKLRTFRATQAIKL